VTTMTATEFTRNISRVLDRMEHGDEEIVVLRNRHPVATLVPGAAKMRALEAFADLSGVLPDEEGERWIKDMHSFDRPAAKELSDPWA